MYIQLRKRTNGNIAAEVRTSGYLPGVGSENSRLNTAPFAVFQIDEFLGLENVDTDNLVEELRRRLTPDQIKRRFGYQLTDADLLEEIQTRMNRT